MKTISAEVFYDQDTKNTYLRLRKSPELMRLVKNIQNDSGRLDMSKCLTSQIKGLWPITTRKRIKVEIAEDTFAQGKHIFTTVRLPRSLCLLDSFAIPIALGRITK